MLNFDNDNEEITRPRRRTALKALKLEHYGIDIAALSETCLSGEDSVTEHGGGYTFNRKGHPEEQPRRHGVGLEIQNELVDKVVEAPTFIYERLVTLKIPLVNEEYAALLSCYAPTLTSKEILKDAFYELLYQALSSIHKDDKIILFGASVWDGVIGRNGVRRMNSSG